MGPTYGLARVGDRLDQARATIAGTLADFVASGPVRRLRICDNPGCHEVFIDHSRTGRRRWCDMRTCGNQAKAARHRARHREIGTAEPLPARGSRALESVPTFVLEAQSTQWTLVAVPDIPRAGGRPVPR